MLQSPTPAPAIPLQEVITSSPDTSTASRAWPPISSAAAPKLTGTGPVLHGESSRFLQQCILSRHPRHGERFIASHSMVPRAPHCSRISAIPARSSTMTRNFLANNGPKRCFTSSGERVIRVITEIFVNKRIGNKI